MKTLEYLLIQQHKPGLKENIFRCLWFFDL